MREYKLIRSDRRTLALQIKEGEVIVRAPRGISEAKIKDFVTAHTDWIDKQLSRYEAKKSTAQEVDVLTETEIKALVKRARAVFAERAEYYAQRLGVSYSGISVRRQRTRWGSCTAKGALSFNAALLLAPHEVLDSVVAHELCHRKHMNHSAAFYTELEAVFPKWRECRRWLRENGDALQIKIGNK